MGIRHVFTLNCLGTAISDVLNGHVMAYFALTAGKGDTYCVSNAFA
jgi:hypothetical protein